MGLGRGDPVYQSWSRVSRVIPEGCPSQSFEAQNGQQGFLLRDQLSPVFPSLGKMEMTSYPCVVVASVGCWSQSRVKAGTAGISGDGSMVKRDWYL